MTTYSSIDSTDEEENSVRFPVEFLNSIQDNGLPPHQLKLKMNTPVILIIDLDPPKLCNGTRIKITALKINTVEGEILTGPFKNELVIIPRIPLTSHDAPVKFNRLQFPIKLCYALTINKGQGQGFQKVGIYLKDQCFSHGQLYVAMSRVMSVENLFICSDNNIVQNIVYKEILN